MPRLGRLVRRVTSVLIVGSLGLAIACGSSSKGPAAANGPLDASGSTDAVTVGGSDQLESPDLATIDSGTPKPSPISITVDSSKRRQPISRYIYGINFFAFDQDFTPTLTRLGGNRWSA